MTISANTWVKNLLRSIVTFALKNSLSFQEFSALARELYVDAAEELLESDTKKINASRIAALTGLHRREVNAVLQARGEGWSPTLSIPLRVLNRWEQDPDYTTKGGKPRVITFEGPESEFSDLVGSISSSLNTGTILFELERIGAVERSARGLRMTEDFHRFGADPDKAFDITGRDFSTLLNAVDENIFRRKKLTNVHLRTEYDNIFLQDLPEIRRWLTREAKDFHRRVRKFVSKFDKDLVRRNSDEEAGKRVAITTFSLTDDF